MSGLINEVESIKPVEISGKETWPVWEVGLSIVLSVLLTSLVAYLCLNRYQLRNHYQLRKRSTLELGVVEDNASIGVGLWQSEGHAGMPEREVEAPLTTAPTDTTDELDEHPLSFQMKK